MTTTNLYEELPLDFLPPYYGALFALAAADGYVDNTEVRYIYQHIHFQVLDEDARSNIHKYLIAPPAIADCLVELRDAPEEIRYGLYMNMLELAQADGTVLDAEQGMIEDVRMPLGVSKEQHDAMLNFLKEVERIKARGENDDDAAKALKVAASGLAAVGVPIAAVYASGAVIGLSAAGITSGLAALGLGLGMVPGIGVVILLGIGVAFGVSKLLSGSKQNPNGSQDDPGQMARLISNIQDAIDSFIHYLEQYQADPEQDEQIRKSIAAMIERLEKIRIAVEQERERSGSTPA